MAADPPADFLTRSEAARIYNRSQRALERDLDNALRAGDSATLVHWKLVTKDGDVRAADQVTIELVKQLQIDGKIPVWYVQESHLDEQYGRKGMPKPARTTERPMAEARSPTTEAQASTTDETPGTEKADPSPNEIEFLRERIRVLEREKREEAERNEQREAKLFEQLAVKDKQISNWDELTQGLIKGVATGQLRPDAGTMLPRGSMPTEERGVADAAVQDAKVVKKGPGTSTQSKPRAASATRTSSGRSSKPRKPNTAKPKISQKAKPTKTRQTENTRWYNTPIRFLSRK